MFQLFKTHDGQVWNREVLKSRQKEHMKVFLSLSGKQPYYQQVTKTIGLEIASAFQLFKTPAFQNLPLVGVSKSWRRE